MSEEIQNAGTKGKALAIAVTAFLLFISLWAYVYNMNGNMKFPY